MIQRIQSGGNLMDRLSDELLVDQSLEGDKASFETLVERYQNLICSIAFSITGDVTQSEDVGQESFVEAWQRLDQLKDTSKFKSWLCAIARNVARNTNRKWSKMQPSEFSDSIPDASVSAEDNVVNHEEERLVWDTLRELPLEYREPLVLYYRQDQSVSQVAESLELSDDAVKQRLSRGRRMLRDEVTASIERALKSSIPSRAFTAAVLAAIPSLTAQTATAASAATTAAAAPHVIGAGTVKSAAAMGTVLGPLLGLAGGLFGAWCGWMSCRYQSQRALTIRASWVYLVGFTLFSVPYAAMYFGWQPWNVFGQPAYTFINIGWLGFFMFLNLLWIFSVIRSNAKLVQHEIANDTPQLPENAITERMNRYEGRRWNSSTELLGLPLVSVSFSDPGSNQASPFDGRVARGWIAIGDIAVGRLLALGNVAAAPIAFGTMSVGVVSFGVMSVGVITAGVLSVGVLAIACVALGGFACGIMSAGYIASGVVAIAWRGAQGVVAIAYQYAVGELAYARHASDGVAKEFVENSTFLEISQRLLLSSADWFRSPTGLLLTALIVIVPLMMLRFAYRRKDNPSA